MKPIALEKSAKPLFFMATGRVSSYYILDKKFQQLISQFPPRQPNPKLEHARVCNMMLSIPDWSPDLFTEIGVNEQSVAGLGLLLDEYMGILSSCYSRKDQQENGETYIKGLLSNLNRKALNPLHCDIGTKKQSEPCNSM